MYYWLIKAFNTFRPHSPSFPNTNRPIVEENCILFKAWTLTLSSKADSLEISLQKTTLFASIAIMSGKSNRIVTNIKKCLWPVLYEWLRKKYCSDLKCECHPSFLKDSQGWIWIKEQLYHRRTHNVSISSNLCPNY